MNLRWALAQSIKEIFELETGFQGQFYDLKRKKNISQIEDRFKISAENNCLL